MIGHTISHYKILEKLGEGGMGIVYKAEDTKLKRTVALKFITPQAVGTEDDKARFIHEAQAAASLNHPNICTVHEIDEYEGNPFIAMEFIDGSSLKDMIEAGPLTLDDTVNIATQVADGLSAAHEKGIVHRDIKSANIMVAGNEKVSIMDFGLAKSAGRTQLTKEGTTLGTIAYMSPEQGQGEPADHRSDIWSLGVVLYEMLSGKQPFRGEFEQAVVYSIINNEPEPLKALRTGVPIALERIVTRCLAKDPAERYQTAKDLAADLNRSLRVDTTQAWRVRVEKAQARKRNRFGFQTPMSRGLWLLLISVPAIAMLITQVIVPRYFSSEVIQSGPQKKMLVVLPFENLGAPEDEYFADGIAEEITSRLAAIKDLGVISRTSALHFKNSNKTVQEIGGELKVDYILEGTVKWERESGGGSRVRVTPRLIRVADDSHVWTERYDDKFEAIFAVQSRIAGQVADKLGIALTGSEERALNARPTENIVAYQLYLRGIDHIIFAHRPEEDYRQAQQFFEQAIAIDPEFALAYAKLSHVHRGLYFYGYERTAGRLEMAKRAIDTALEIDPDLAEAQRELGYYYYQGLLDYDRALAEFSRVAKVLPNDARLLEDISFIWRRQGRMQEALANQHSAFAMNPTYAALCVEIAYTYAWLRMHADALAYCDRAIAMAPDNHWGYFLKSIVLLGRSGDVDAARAALESCPDTQSHVIVWARYFFDMLARDYQAALERLEKLDEDLLRMQNGYFPVSMLKGIIYDCLGERTRAAAAFESSLALLDRAALDNPEDARVRSSLGITYAGLGRKEEAIAAGRKAVEMYPVSRDAILGVDRMVNLAQIYAMVGETGPALEMIRSILSIPAAYTIYYFELHPCFDAVRAEPGFQEIRREFGREPQ
jgi:serine/threonine protein kinase/tetratricopeptide (TPR) repeat protein